MKMIINRKYTIMVIAITGILMPLFYLFSAPTNKSACCAIGTSYGDSIVNPAKGGDNDMFTQTSAPPNVYWLLDNSGSMQSLPCDAGSGCGDASGTCKNSAGQNLETNGGNFFIEKGYNNTTTYPGYDPDFCQAGNPNNYSGSDGCYKPDLVYYHYYRTSCTTNYGNNNVWRRKGNNDTNSTVTNFCSTRGGVDCENYLNNSGYYYYDNELYIKGNVLNFYPPKFVVSRRVMKNIILDPDQGIRRVRMGIAFFESGSNNANNFNANNNPDGAAKPGTGPAKDFNPECNQYPDPANDSNRGAIANSVNGAVFNTYTPLAESLFNIGQYYSNDGTCNSISIFASPYHKNTFYPPNCGVQRSVCVECQLNGVIIVTDGMPTQDFYLPPAIVDKDTDGYKIDDVAEYLNKTDLWPGTALEGNQNIITYVVSFGLVDPGSPNNCAGLLQKTAQKGDGKCYVGKDAASLGDSIKEALEDIIRRSTSFSNIGTSTFQVSGQSGALIPRFTPSQQTLWEGHLYRFNMYNEPVTGVDLNNDGDKTDQLVTDYDNDIVTVDSTTGNPVKKKNNNPAREYWDAGKCLSDSAYIPPSGVSCYTSSSDRKIYTAVDLNNDGIIASQEKITFSLSNLASIKDYLGLEGNAYCSGLSTQLGIAFPSTTAVSSCAVTPFTDNALNYCACLLIEFVRGKDILDEDIDGNRNEDRTWKLGDIFHSTPTIIEPPGDDNPPTYYKRLCDRGLNPQCVSTLYAPEAKTGTSIQIYAGGKDAFDNYIELFKKRQRIVVVGANDGMLHAFVAGSAIDGDDQSTPLIKEPYYFDTGTGKEAWAFIPPDQLPKLKNLTQSGKHTYFLDSTPWIRDIWTDLNDDNIKQCGSIADCEYRTLLISGERGGGTHYFAIDVTDVSTPEFRWIFPQPCSEDSLRMGETYSESLPLPPPVGPIKLYNKEKYVAFLNGGFDPLDLKGRGVFVRNAWTGEKIWDFVYDSSDFVKKNLKYSIPAVVASFDWGIASDPIPKQDLFWDIAFVGDAGGQLWTLRFLDSDPLNWFGARIFVQENNLPFFHIALPGYMVASGNLRVALGTGDRENINDCKGGDCKYDNFRACALKGCSNISVSMTQMIADRKLDVSKLWNASLVPGVDAFDWTGSLNVNNACSSITGYTIGAYRCNLNTSPNYNKIYPSSTTCGDKCSGTANCSNTQTYGPMQISGCSVASDSSGTDDATPEKNAGVICNTDSVCTEAANYDKLVIDMTTSITAMNKFYARNTPRNFDNPADAASIDSAYLTDSGLLDPDDINPVGEYTAGWRYSYSSINRRTAQGGQGMFGGCVTWPAYEPNCTTGNSSTDVCFSPGAGIGYLFQADFISGKANCLSSFNGARNISIGVTVPPPPTLSIVVAGSKIFVYSVTGEWYNPPGAMSSMSLIPGTVYWMEIPMILHDCKHDGKCSAY